MKSTRRHCMASAAFNLVPLFFLMNTLPADNSCADPVCGMKVAADSEIWAEWGGKRYGFCWTGCRDKFLAEPQKYLIGRKFATGGNSNSSSQKFVCPMDPEVVSDRPAACHKCGMALEPALPERGTGEFAEYRQMKRRFGLAVVLAAPVIALAMGAMISPRPGGGIPWRVSAAVQMIFALAVVFGAGWPFLERAAASVVARRANMFTLVAFGTGAAMLHGIVTVLWPHGVPGAGEHTGMPPVYFESAVGIVVFVLLGQMLELRARSRTGDAMRLLLDLAPKTARCVRSDGSETDIPLSEVRVGDRLRIRPGEKIPTDGAVIEGISSIDESMFTGESLPVAKFPGVPVTGGSLNGTGGLIIEARKVGSETLLAQIVRMVAEAQRSRAPIQNRVDKVAEGFVPAVILAAIVTAVVWVVVGPEPRFGHALVNAVSVLIIACPCALGLATPISVMVGIGKGATEGILIRDARALQAFRKVDALVVDKTGTLTEGCPMLLSVEPAQGTERARLLAVAAGIERSSEHPLARAIMAGAQTRGVTAAAVSGFRSVTGKGVAGVLDGKTVFLGHEVFMANAGIKMSEALRAKGDELRQSGQTVVWVAEGGEGIGLLGIADPVRDSAAESLRRLRAGGIRVFMATGDHAETARVVAERVGIPPGDVRAGVLPRQKADFVRELQSQRFTVAMAGDGVNDAPALAAADVGIGMGGGADIAIQSAGIVLVGGDLRGIVRARTLSGAVMRNIRQNLFWAFGYNLICVPIAAGALYPLWGILLSPMLAAAAMSMSSVSVILNAIRLSRLNLRSG